jgi:hypothetical protein
LKFVENPLIDNKEILKAGKDFSNSVLSVPIRIFKTPLESDGQQARKEMVRHVERVSNELMAV